MERLCNLVKEIFGTSIKETMLEIMNSKEDMKVLHSLGIQYDTEYKVPDSELVIEYDTFDMIKDLGLEREEPGFTIGVIGRDGSFVLDNIDFIDDISEEQEKEIRNYFN